MYHRSLVVGGGRGIGSSIAAALADEGNVVGVVYRQDEAAARATAEAVQARGASCLLLRADARDEVEVKRVLDVMNSECGALDTLVNCTHTPLQPTPFHALDWHAIESQVAGTLKAAFLFARHSVPLLERSEHPAILNMSSVTVVRPELGFLHRNVAKAALEEFTRCLAREVAVLGIRVNALSVGWTETDQVRALDDSEVQRHLDTIPLNRLAKPQEVAETARFLLSESASYITGMVFPVDGGIDGNPR